MLLSIYLSINLFIYQSIHLLIYLSINLFIYQSIYLSIYLSINLFIYQSIYLMINLPTYIICISRSSSEDYSLQTEESLYPEKWIWKQETDLALGR